MRINNPDFNKKLEFHRSIIPGVEIKQCRGTPHAYKAHVHKELSLGIISGGSTALTLNDNKMRFTAGDGVVIPPVMTHRCEPDDITVWEYSMLYVDPNYYRSTLHFTTAKRITGIQADRLHSFINTLIHEQAPEILESVLVELLLEFCDAEDADTANEPAEQIREYILSRVSEPLTLIDLERNFNMNKFTIIRRFIRVYSTTPASFHLQYRVAEAKKMLAENMDVFDICNHLGFYDQAHFIKEFKKMNGITPSKYVAQLCC